MPLARSTLLAACAALLLPLGAAALDRDGDGLDDRLEAALLARFAPLVLLAPGESALPASVPWFLARSGEAPAPPFLAAGILGPPLRRRPRLRPSRAARGGSRDPRDWVVYGHVVPARDGGVLVQYWFFYAFNDGHWLFDHEGDWEHVTVRLGPDLAPAGAWYARHDDSHPGRWFAWGALSHEGEHPVVLSARGTHASYASPGEVAFYDRACPSADPAAAPRAGCAVWRTWAPGAGGVLDLGERGRPGSGADFLAWPGEWGATGWLGRDGGAPRGPAFQRGWCAGAAPRCDDPVDAPAPAAATRQP